MIVLPCRMANTKTPVELVAHVLPIIALFQIADVLASVSGGILRGQGRQYMYASSFLQTFFCSDNNAIMQI